MGRHDRTIQVAINEITNKIVVADEVFATYKSGYEARALIHTNALKLICCECGAPLNISSSRRQKLHFKHYPGHDYCILSSDRLSEDEIDVFTHIQVTKESDRHKFLKNYIGNRLKHVQGVVVDSIAIDNQFITRGAEKRRPDVYCRYKDKEIVFEIQLSELSLSYILGRYNFYKRHGIYLIWILDNYDVRNPPPFARDIKYLAPYQNHFKVDETVDDFKLICEYKKPLLTKDNVLLTPWMESSISLEQLSFESLDKHIYFYDFPAMLAAKEIEQTINEEKQVAEKQMAAERSYIHKAQVIIKEIAALKKQNAVVYDWIELEINELSNDELRALNNELGLTVKGKAALSKWVRETTRENIEFLRFILRCERIALNVNEKSADGKSCFLEFCDNSIVSSSVFKNQLFKRGYNLTVEDKAYIENELMADVRSQFAIYLLLERLNDRTLVDIALKCPPLLYIIESAKRRKIFGSKLSDWVAFANNAIEYYDIYWESIARAFEFYGIMELIISKDSKKSFRNKLTSYHNRMPVQSREMQQVLKDLYPEVYTDNSFPSL